MALLGHIFLYPLTGAPTASAVGGGWAGPGPNTQGTLYGQLTTSLGGPLTIMAERSEQSRTRDAGSSSGKSHSGLGSLRWASGPLVLTAGSRFLPMESEFLASPSHRSRLGELPSRRERTSVFVGPSAPGPLQLPGMFLLGGMGGVGAYVQPSKGITILSHPTARMAGLVARGDRALDANTSIDWLLDAARTGYSPESLSPDEQGATGERLWEGYVRLRVRRAGRTLMRIYGLRDNDWDLSEGRVVPERRGRSGSAALVSRPFEYFSYEGAGIERGDLSFRMAGVTVGENDNPGFSFLLRARFYRSGRTSGESECCGPTAPAPRDAEAIESESMIDRGLGPGISWNSRHERLIFFVEGRKRGFPTAQLELRHQQGALTLSAALLLRRASANDQLLYTESRSFRDGGPLFFHDAERVLRVEVRSRNVALLVATSLRSGKPDHYGSLQLHWPLSGSRPEPDAHTRPPRTFRPDNVE